MGVMEHFLLLVPGPLPGCIFMRHIILALFTVCRYGIAVGLLTVRPGRYGKERRASRSAAGQVGKGVTV
jgi:hypothetical protein